MPRSSAFYCWSTTFEIIIAFLFCRYLDNGKCQKVLILLTCLDIQLRNYLLHSCKGLNQQLLRLLKNSSILGECNETESKLLQTPPLSKTKMKSFPVSTQIFCSKLNTAALIRHEYLRGSLLLPTFNANCLFEAQLCGKFDGLISTEMLRQDCYI